jgi:hypothetical protein
LLRSRLTRLNSPFIGFQVDVPSIPHGDGLYEDTLLLSMLHVPDDIEPCPNIYVALFCALQYMFNVQIHNNRVCRDGVVVFEA